MRIYDTLINLNKHGLNFTKEQIKKFHGDIKFYENYGDNEGNTIAFYLIVVTGAIENAVDTLHDRKNCPGDVSQEDRALTHEDYFLEMFSRSLDGIHLADYMDL